MHPEYHGTMQRESGFGSIWRIRFAGFNCLTWDYHADCRVAVSQTDDPITQICQAAKQFGIAVSFGYIEKAGGNAKPECGYRSVAGVV